MYSHTSFSHCGQLVKCASGARLTAPPAIKPALCTYLPNQHNTTFIAAGPQGAEPDNASSAWQCVKMRCASAVSLKWCCVLNESLFFSAFSVPMITCSWLQLGGEIARGGPPHVYPPPRYPRILLKEFRHYAPSRRNAHWVRRPQKRKTKKTKNCWICCAKAVRCSALQFTQHERGKNLRDNAWPILHVRAYVILPLRASGKMRKRGPASRPPPR